MSGSRLPFLYRGFRSDRVVFETRQLETPRRRPQIVSQDPIVRRGGRWVRRFMDKGAPQWQTLSMQADCV